MSTSQKEVENVYKSLTRFLDTNNIYRLVGYDFKNESPVEEVRLEQNPIQKMMAYKKSYKEKNSTFDCDNSNGSCSLADSIYQTLWGWTYKSRFSLPANLQESFGNSWSRLGSDTMNSFSTIYRQSLRLNGNNKTVVDRNENMQKFATLTHTIGNLTLVPFKLDFERDISSFNMNRGFRGGKVNKYFVYDFFDLSLKLIRENVDLETFQRYIDTFYLQDFVEVHDNYKIKPLMRKHEQFLLSYKMDVSNTQAFLPSTNEEVNEFLVNVNTLITKRSERIVNALKDKLRIQMNPIEIPTQSRFARLKTVKEGKNKYKGVSNWVKVTFLTYTLTNIGVLVYLDKTEIGVKESINQYGLLVVLRELIVRYSSFTLTLTLIVVLVLGVLSRIFSTVFGILLDSMGRCDECHKMFSMKQVRTDIVDSKSIQILTELNQRNVDGEVTGTVEQYVAGTRETYEKIYECKQCNYTYSKKRVREYINT